MGIDICHYPDPILCLFFKKLMVKDLILWIFFAKNMQQLRPVIF